MSRALRLGPIGQCGCSTNACRGLATFDDGSTRATWLIQSPFARLASPKYGRAFSLHMIQKEDRVPRETATRAELIAAFQKIPQRYCLLCKSQDQLGD